MPNSVRRLPGGDDRRQLLVVRQPDREIWSMPKARTMRGTLVDAVMLQLHWVTQEHATDITPSSSDLYQSKPRRTCKRIRTTRPGCSIAGKRTIRSTSRKHAAEKEVLDYFIHEPRPTPAALEGPPEWRDERVADKQEYHYFQAVRLRKDCIDCHQLFQPAHGARPLGIPAPPRRRSAI